ncbi:MAG: transposase [Chloroflexi bacterium]|nr:transposase [Chloroflexota bacterium]
MPQSISRLYVHLVFSTRMRQFLIDDVVRTDLHEFMRGVLYTRGDYPEMINSVADHIHILFQLGRMSSMSAVVEDLKTTSSKWMKLRDPKFHAFYWQKGYGAFAVNSEKLSAVRKYIADQQIQHAHQSFQDEYRALLQDNGAEWDERYVWD